CHSPGPIPATPFSVTEIARGVPDRRRARRLSEKGTVSGKGTGVIVRSTRRALRAMTPVPFPLTVPFSLRRSRPRHGDVLRVRDAVAGAEAQRERAEALHAGAPH